MDQDISAVYQAVVDAHPAARLSEPFALLELDLDVRRIGHPAADLLAELQRQFPLDVLQCARVVRASENQAPTTCQLTAALSTPGRLLLGLRRSSAAMPYDIVTAQGSMRNATAPSLLSVCCDYRFRSGLEIVNTLFVTFSPADLALLRACGLAATLGDRLASLGHANLDAICDLMGWDRAGRECDLPSQCCAPADSSDASADAIDTNGGQHSDDQPGGGGAPEERVTAGGQAESHDEIDEKLLGICDDNGFVGGAAIVVVEGGISTPSIARDLAQRLVAHWARLRRDLAISMSDVHLWTPDPQDPRLRTALIYGTAGDVREALLQAASQARPIIAAERQAEKPTSMPEQWRAARARTDESLLAAAEAAKNPLRRERLLRLLQLRRQLGQVHQTREAPAIEKEKLSVLLDEQHQLERRLNPWPPHKGR